MRLPRLLVLVLTVSALAFGGCPWDDDDDCGSDDAGVEAPAPDASDPGALCTDPCQGDLLFGPETFDRTYCEPDTEYRTFDVANAGDVCIVVTNAGNSAAWIKVNGIKYIKPNDFNPWVTEVTETLSLTAGTHDLSVRLASQPGTSITVEVRACDEGPPPQRLCSEVAREFCESKGWNVVGLPELGNIVCTTNGLTVSDNCATCSEYNMVVWTDGSPERECGSIVYSTVTGWVYGGHIPCTCSDNLYTCNEWDTQGCIPD